MTSSCHADTRFTMQRAAAVASRRSELALPVAVADAPLLEPPAVPAAAQEGSAPEPPLPTRVRGKGCGRPCMGQRPSVVRRTTRIGRAFFIAQTREISGERTYLGSFDTHETAMEACLAYMNTGEKSPHLQPGRPKGEWSQRSPEERRAYHREKQKEYTQRSREKQKGTVPQRHRAAMVPPSPRPPRNSRVAGSGAPAPSAEFLAARLEMLKAAYRRTA